MGAILDWFFGKDEETNKQPAKPSCSYGWHRKDDSSSCSSPSYPYSKASISGCSKETVTASAPIIDPKRISMVKAHTIIGSIEKHGRATKFAKLVSWLEKNEIEIAKKTLDSSKTHLLDHALALRPPMPGGNLAYGPGCFGTTKPRSTTYALGDTHGDLESLVAALDTIIVIASNKGDLEPTVYLLGDVIDRNTESCMQETVFILAILQKAFTGDLAKYNNIKLGIIKGDHDVALAYDETAKRFNATVSPADYCDWLNARIDLNKNLEDATYIGRAWIALMKECPAAAFIESSGTLLSHGGIPRSDLQEKIKAGVPFCMQSEDCAVDFEWCRMVDAKNKLLNRASKTSEVGFQEFEALSNDVFGGKIRKFIFAHQHPAKGFQRLDKFYSGYDVLCLSSFRADDTLGGPTVPYFCKIDADEVNVYSMSPAAYVVRLEENSIEHHKEIAAKA